MLFRSVSSAHLSDDGVYPSHSRQHIFCPASHNRTIHGCRPMSACRMSAHLTTSRPLFFTPPVPLQHLFLSTSLPSINRPNFTPQAHKQLLSFPLHPPRPYCPHETGRRGWPVLVQSCGHVVSLHAQCSSWSILSLNPNGEKKLQRLPQKSLPHHSASALFCPLMN